MQRLKVSGAVRPLKWPLGVKWLKYTTALDAQTLSRSVMLSVCLFASLEVWFSRLLFGIYGGSKILTGFL
jgi:hypothetical protein